MDGCVPFLTLDIKGIEAGVAIGAVMLVFGGSFGLLAFGMLFWFLFLSAIVTNVGITKKRKLGLYEKTRSYKNVFANGLVPMAIAVLFGINAAHHFAPSVLIGIAYFSSVAAITADKFASEIGVLDGFPISLISLRRVEKGTSGGVTVLGTFASAVGAALIGCMAFFLSHGILSYVAFAAIIFVSGIIGNIADSFLGYFEEKGIGNKYTSNFMCALAGAIVGVAIALLAGV
ncbi:MAG: DUF92 domain-containing protein [Candidatus Micrarchaeia archaeon]